MDLRLRGIGRHLIVLLCSASGIAIASTGVVEWVKHLDNPSWAYKKQEGSFTYRNRSFHVVLECTCPQWLIQGRQKTLKIKVSILPSVQGEWPAGSNNDSLDVTLSAGLATIQPEASWITDSKSLETTDAKSQDILLQITPSNNSALEAIDLGFFSIQNVNDLNRASLASIPFKIESDPDAWSLLSPFVVAIAVFAFVTGLFVWAERRITQAREKAERRLTEATEQAAANPGQARFAWDLARVKLEAYFDRNLIQVNLVFWLAVTVMGVGFGFVLAGIAISYRQPGNEVGPHAYTSIVAAGAGIITQFIGATFLVIYRSTMAQANGFMTVLERINNAGMAVQVLDSLPDGTDLKNNARAQIAKLLLIVKSSSLPSDHK